MLTKAKLKKIEEIIRKRYLAFTYEALGERALTDEEVALLTEHGLLRTGTRHFTGDAYALGKIVANLDKTIAATVTLDTALRAALKVPVTTVEKKAIEYASEHAGEYIKGIGTDIVKEFRATSARASRTALQAVQEEVAATVADRLTISQLKSNLYGLIEGKKRDWLKVASTEVQDAIQHGIHSEIKRTGGEEALVYKRPSPNACKHCKKVYLLSDGVTPKIFKLSSLTASNIGLKGHEYGPTIGPVHPFCQCQLSPVPSGWGFVTKIVAAENFGRYKAGQVIEDFSSLTDEEKAKTRKEAILTFTGEEAAEMLGGLEKSLYESEEDDVCECEY